MGWTTVPGERPRSRSRARVGMRGFSLPNTMLGLLWRIAVASHGESAFVRRALHSLPSDARIVRATRTTVQGYLRWTPSWSDEPINAIPYQPAAQFALLEYDWIGCPHCRLPVAPLATPSSGTKCINLFCSRGVLFQKISKNRKSHRAAPCAAERRESAWPSLQA